MLFVSSVIPPLFIAKTPVSTIDRALVNDSHFESAYVAEMLVDYRLPRTMKRQVAGVDSKPGAGYYTTGVEAGDSW